MFRPHKDKSSQKFVCILGTEEFEWCDVFNSMASDSTYLPGLMFWWRILIYLSRSDLICSCRYPNACIISWIIFPVKHNKNNEQFFFFLIFRTFWSCFKSNQSCTDPDVRQNNWRSVKSLCQRPYIVKARSPPLCYDVPLDPHLNTLS